MQGWSGDGEYSTDERPQGENCVSQVVDLRGEMHSRRLVDVAEGTRDERCIGHCALSSAAEPVTDDAILEPLSPWRQYGVPAAVLVVGSAVSIYSYLIGARSPGRTDELAAEICAMGGVILSALMAAVLWTAGMRRAAAAEIARKVTMSLRESEHRLQSDFG